MGHYSEGGGVWVVPFLTGYKMCYNVVDNMNDINCDGDAPSLNE